MASLNASERITVSANLEVYRASAYRRLWKDADPDLPILKEAKSEYAKLQ